MTSTSWDVVVVGGGPGGSAAASLLAGTGRRVLIVEQETFPRHHVGESTLLSIHSPLRWLGVAEKVEATGFRHKTGATYIWGVDREPWSFHFAELGEGLDGWRRPYSYEVERDAFDEILLDRAVECGAEVRHAQVEELLTRGERVVGIRCRRPGGELEDVEARWVVDASGQSCLAGRQFGWRRPNLRLRAAALYGYWSGGPPRYELLGGDLTPADCSNILVCSTGWGWIWLIPQRGSKVSVGAVITAGSDRPPAQGAAAAYRRLIDDCDDLRPILSHLELSSEEPIRSVSDWSYCCDRFFAPGLILVGDAACFVDPILSSGLHLTLRASIAAACALGSTLSGGDEGLAGKWYESTYRFAYHQYEQMALWWYHGDRRQTHWFQAAMAASGETGEAAEADAELARQAFMELASGLPRGGYVTVPLGRNGGAELSLISLFHAFASYSTNNMHFLRDRLGAPHGNGEKASAPPPVPVAPLEVPDLRSGLAWTPGVELRLQADPGRVRLDLLAGAGEGPDRKWFPVGDFWPVLAAMDGERSLSEIGDALAIEPSLRDPVLQFARHLERNKVLRNVR